MPHYPPSASLRDARAQYFAIAGFKNGGYDDRWVRLKAGPFRFGFPNTAARVRVVRLHDLHHVLTEYDTSWTGEAQIGAWEIASGCGRYLTGWIINLGALAIGLVITPRKTYRAFIHGRHCANLYPSVFREDLLERHVGEMREELSIRSEAPSANDADRIMFILWSIIAVATYLAPFAIALAALALLLARK